MTKTRLSTLTLIAALGSLLTACGGPDLALAELAGDADHSEPSLAPRGEVLSAPSQLACVSSANEGEVTRVRLSPEYEGARTLSLSTGPVFHFHENGAQMGEEIELFSGAAKLALNHKSLAVEAEAAELSLNRDGGLFTGTVRSGETSTPLTCWDPATLYVVNDARYDPSVGHCVGSDGKPALNDMPIELIRETGFGDCADLRGVRLNGDDFGYPMLSWWSLNGANLDGAELYFADLVGASLHGTQMAGLEFGYANIDGRVDDSTQIPEEGCELGESNPWSGQSVFCAL